MKKFILSFLFPIFALALTGTDQALLGIGNINYLTNPGFESGRGGWSASGGTFTATTASANVQFGRGSVLWDSNASSQSLLFSGNVALDSNNGLKGQSGLFSCYVKVPSGTATHLLQVFVGTTQYTQAITSSPTGFRTNLYFPITTASSQTLNNVGIVSVASNEPEIIIDDCFLGSASGAGAGIFNVTAPTLYIGGLENAGASTCVYFENTSSGITNYVDLGTSSGCAAWTATNNTTQFGTISAQATNDHRLVFTNMAAGNYVIYVQGSFVKGGTVAGSCYYRLSDGTNSYQLQGIAQGASAVLGTSGFTYHVNITSAGTRTYKLQAADDHASSCSWENGANINASWKVYRFPAQGEPTQAAAANQTDFGYKNAGPVTITGSTTNPTKGTIVKDEFWYRRKGENLEFIYNYEQSTAGANGSGDYIFTLPTVTGCTINTTVTGVNTTIGANSGTDHSSVGSGGAGVPSVAAGSAWVAIYSTTQFRIIAAVSATVQSVGSGQYALGSTGTMYTVSGSFPCSNWAENQRAPTLIGSVTSDYSGAINDCFIGVDSVAGVPTIDKNYGSCVSSITDNATGVSTVNFTAGKFSQAPVCQCTVFSVSGANIAHICHMETEPTTSSVQIVTSTTGTGDADLGYQLRCAGPR